MLAAMPADDALQSMLLASALMPLLRHALPHWRAMLL